MTVRAVWLAGAAILGTSIAGCEVERDSSEGRQSQEASSVTAPGNRVQQRSDEPESIIREDVRAETEAPPEPEIKPLEATLDFSEAEGSLPTAAAASLDELLNQPALAQGGCILISGHTDSRGSDDQNLKVSERRARLVGEYLVERGVERERIRLIALGERRPIAPNAKPDGSDDPEGRARNRRVTIEVKLPDPGTGQACAATH